MIACCVLSASLAHDIILTGVKHLKNSMIGRTPEIREFTTEYHSSINNACITHNESKIFVSRTEKIGENDSLRCTHGSHFVRC